MKRVGVNLVTGALILAVVLCQSIFAGHGGSTMAPDEAMEILEAGNKRFAEGECRYPHTDMARIHETSEFGQHPFVTVIGCSDSRVPIEMLFDQGIGDVFVIRVAGNVCDVDEVGSIEYGVDHLETPLMVVLGHTHCGAVTAVATGAEVHGSIPELVDNIVPAVDRVRLEEPHLEGDAFIEASVRENVWQSIEELFDRSDAVRQRVNGHSLKVVGAIYDIESGRVEWMGEHPNQRHLVKSAQASMEDHH